MKEELLAKLKKINPANENGIPKNKGNCQWCAIEGARVLLEGVEPREIPNGEGGMDPIEERVHTQHGDEFVTESQDFWEKIQNLNKGDLMLVSLEGRLDHAYIIYRDEENDKYLIDPDRQIFVKVDKGEDFLQDVKGWEEAKKINYLNGKVDKPFIDTVKATICVLTKEEVESKPLPEYGSEPTSTLKF